MSVMRKGRDASLSHYNDKAGRSVVIFMARASFIPVFLLITMDAMGIL